MAGACDAVPSGVVRFLYCEQENDYSMNHFRNLISEGVGIVGGGIWFLMALAQYGAPCYLLYFKSFMIKLID